MNPHSSALSGFALLLALSCACRGADWPCLGGGPSRNMVNSAETNIPAAWDLRPAKDGGNLKWRAELGTRCFAGPAVASGRVFVGTNNERPRDPRDAGRPRPTDKGVLMCFRESDGTFLWQRATGKLDDAVAHDWPREGICSTPWVEGGRLFYVTNRAEVACLDVTNGNVVWSFDLIRELGVQVHRMSSSSPLVVGDLVYVVTGNGVDTDKTHVPAPKGPSFVALDRNTGKLAWLDSSPGAGVLHGQWSSPAYGEIGGVPQVIYGGGDGWLRAFEPKTGKPLWQFDGNRKAARLAAGGQARLNYFVATPVIAGDRVYVGTGQNPEFTDGAGDLWCVAPAGKTGDVSAEWIDRDSHFYPAVRDNPNSAVAWHRGGSNPDAKAPAPWLFGRTISTVAVRGGMVYAAELSGLLYCLDAATGKLCWMHDLKEVVWGSPLWADGKVIVPTYGEEMFVFRHGREKELLARNKLDGAVATAPVVANGVLYVATERSLFAIGAR